MTDDMQDALKRLRQIEQDIAVMKVKVAETEKKQEDFQSGVNRGLWIVGGGLLAAIVSFIIQGGLSRG